MSTPISNQSLLQNAASASTAKNESTAGKIQEQKPTTASLRNDLNTQIIEASMKVSISMGDNAQGLLFRSALESIYEAMGSAFESRITPEYQVPQTIDSSETAANTILSFSLGFFDKYAAQHPDKDEATLATDFINLVRGGFEKGFNEAVDILKGLKVFEGSIAEEIGKTWELVQKGYDDWLASRLSPAKPEVETPAGETKVSE